MIEAFQTQWMHFAVVYQKHDEYKRWCEDMRNDEKVNNQ